MNIPLIMAFVLCGGTIAADRIRRLPQWLAIALYTAGVALFVAGIWMRSKAGA